MMRSHYSGHVDETLIGQEVEVCGWVHRRRDHGGVIFVDLRDREGLLQVVFDPDRPESFAEAERIRSEDGLKVKGLVRQRPEGTINPNMPTGQVEVLAHELEVLNRADTPPFHHDEQANEEMRLKYRYLDLRREDMLNNLSLRHKVTTAMREFLDGDGFVDVETPMLTRATPEGARDYIVPSRTHQGKFFALPQSPQIFKQLLMMSGLDRYYQIVRCFRDEDLRADRQPEFTQLDMEMSFVDEEQVIEVVEGMISALFEQTRSLDVKPPFSRISYDQAMARFGTDRPDTRFGLELVDLTAIAAGCDFKVFRSAADSGGTVRAINAKGCGSFTRKELDDLTEFAIQFGAKGLAWVKVKEDGSWQSPIAKFFSAEEQQKIDASLGAEPGDLLFFGADKSSLVFQVLGELRNELARRLELLDKDRFDFVWVTDFPLVEYDDKEKRYQALHHPFTAPREEDIDKLEQDPEAVYSRAYDLVLNGNEIGGGSIRIHDAEVQMRVLKALSISEEEAEEKFGFLLKSLQYGAPPHGGIAFGLDRLLLLITGSDSIRNVTAFPKTQKATCPLTDAPSPVVRRQLTELHIRPDWKE